MKIYTKTGDDGTTGLQGNIRVSKSDDRIAAYGAVDEINACLGQVIAENISGDTHASLTRIQNELFVLGADLSNVDMNDQKNRIQLDQVQRLESDIDVYERELEQLTNFILPGGVKAAALLHVARTITRRAEAAVVRVQQNSKINTNCVLYLNRLSDMLFVLARVTNKRGGVPDAVWKP